METKREYFHPVIEQGKRATIYRSIRYPESIVDPLLADPPVARRAQPPRRPSQPWIEPAE